MQDRQLQLQGTHRKVSPDHTFNISLYTVVYKSNILFRVFNALAEQQDLRGTIVQQGGAKALIPLALAGE